MKSLQLIFLTVALVYSAPTGHVVDETPICKTKGHLNQVYLRNIYDPTKYWGCFEPMKRAESLNCPPNKAFDENTGECVEWDIWEWMEPSEEIKNESENNGNSNEALYTEGHDGRPGCKTTLEVNSVYWRNNNDPTKYWRCEIKNKPGTEVSCPDGFAYSSAISICVTLDHWEWTSPVDPPTLA